MKLPIQPRLSFVFALLLVALFRVAPPLAASPQDGSPPVLRINGEPVDRDTYGTWLLLNRGELLAPRFAEDWVARREVERLGASIDHEAVAREIEVEFSARIDGAFDGDREAWRAELANSGRSEGGRLAERRIDLGHRAALTAIAAVDRTISDEALRREWERVHGPGGRRFDVRLFFRRITLSARPGETRDERLGRRQEVRDEISAYCKRIRDRVLAGESFAELAKELSQDAGSAATGGVPRNGFLTTGWPASAIDGLAALEPGEVSDPIEARGGIWLVQLEGVTLTPFEKVRDELHAELVRRGPTPEEVTAVEMRLRENVSFQILPALFLGRAPERNWLDDPVLQIDGVEIPRGEYLTWIMRLRGELNARRYMQQWALDDAAARAGIVITPEALDARVEEDIERTIEFFFDDDRQKWLDQLGRTGRSEASFRRESRSRVRGEMIADELLRGQRNISDEAVREAWEERYGRDGHLIELRWIRLDMIAPEPKPGETPEQRREALDAVIEATKKRILDLRQRVEDGEDFETLAREHSDDPATRLRGGVPEEGYDPRRFPSAATPHIESLPIGGLSDPIVAANQVFLIEITNLSHVPLARVEKELRAALQNRRATSIEVAGVTQELFSQATLEVLPAMFE